MKDPLTELALAAAAGDDAALGEVVAATQHKVRRLCAHLGSANDAEDLAQETYLRAMRSLSDSAKLAAVTAGRGTAAPAGIPARAAAKSP